MRRWMFALVLSVTLALVLSPARPASAQAALQISDAAAEYIFGNSLMISARLQSEQPPQRALVFYRNRGQDVSYSAEAQLQDGLLTLIIDLSGRPLQAFNEVEYWFGLTLADGSQVVSETYSFFYGDNRYDWHELRGGPFQVYWYDADLTFGQSVLDTCQAALKRVSSLLPQPQVQPVRVYVYASSAELQSALSISGMTMVAGHANPGLGLMLISVSPTLDGVTELQRQAPHELTHVMLYQKYGANYQKIPTWLNEGLASNMEEMPNPDYRTVLEQAAAGSGLFSFNSLCTGFPADVNSFYLSYAQSEWFVRYLRQTYGDSAMQQLLARYADGVDCEHGPQQVYNQDLQGLQGRWLRQLQQDLDITPALESQPFFDLLPWLVLLGLLLLPLLVGIGRLALHRPEPLPVVRRS